MEKWFMYNWQVRDQWLEWCKNIEDEELLKNRTGGPGSLLFTLFHIMEVEYSWIRAILGKEDIVFHFEDYRTLEEIQALSAVWREEIAPVIKSYPDIKHLLVRPAWEDQAYTADDILHHIIAHAIHHIGQLSVWAREIGCTPVSAAYLGRPFPAAASSYCKDRNK